VVAFGDKTVRELMTPRPRIVAIHTDATLEELRELVLNEQFSRVPAYEHTIDEIEGFVHVRDMFELDEKQRARRRVRDIMRPIRAVPETKRVTDLLREMQEEGAHMVVVVDEYGSTAGIVTMEDMVEEIVGEIHDEHEPDRDFREEPDGSFVVSGSFDLGRLSDLVDFHPLADIQSTTVGGLVTEWLGHVPTVGEEVEREGLSSRCWLRITCASIRCASRRPRPNETPGTETQCWLQSRLRRDFGAPQRGQIHVVERAGGNQARYRRLQAADHAHFYSRRADARFRARQRRRCSHRQCPNRIRRHAWNSQDPRRCFRVT
jgi:Mg2+/Co2+ transporter CorC